MRRFSNASWTRSGRDDGSSTSSKPKRTIRRDKLSLRSPQPTKLVLARTARAPRRPGSASSASARRVQGMAHPRRDEPRPGEIWPGRERRRDVLVPTVQVDHEVAGQERCAIRQRQSAGERDSGAAQEAARVAAVGPHAAAMAEITVEAADGAAQDGGAGRRRNNVAVQGDRRGLIPNRRPARRVRFAKPAAGFAWVRGASRVTVSPGTQS